MAHYDETKNRFNPENRFVGDIENGKRYPFGCYSKEEADERFASKATVTEMQTTILAMQAQIADMNQRIEALEYKSISIQTFTAAPNLIEIGSDSTINLVWSLNKAATSQNINGVEVSGTTKQFTGVSSTTSYNLSVSDGQTSANKTITVAAANQIYYGVDTDLEDVTNLTKVLSDRKTRTITVNAGAGEYIIYAYPSRLGGVEFWVENFEGGFEPPVEQNFTNESGYTEKYYVYRSTNANLGETTVEIKEA